MDKHDGGDPLALRVDDPWRDAGGAGLWVPDQEAPAAPPVAVPPAAAGAAGDRGAVFQEVQHSAAFQEVRGRYRGFVFPVAAAFVAWYLLYVVLATTAPGLMARQVTGEVNVAMVAGLAQFATTFLLTWAYVRHARLRRDRAALDLRWTLATRTGQERVR
ncbi:DUF485 domain-containing protein [Streptomyces sp. NBC_01198]|uniref:DUF485 domain-containing protein n=1 Tax=Streptomyces sp. NBC_01198 TaxID=2903769 RepID=UPI002E0E3F00|nr:DUF485 domain-containing protein [Streptomyces sp. NBC_01198]